MAMFARMTHSKHTRTPIFPHLPFFPREAFNWRDGEGEGAEKIMTRLNSARRGGKKNQT